MYIYIYIYIFVPGLCWVNLSSPIFLPRGVAGCWGVALLTGRGLRAEVLRTFHQINAALLGLGPEERRSGRAFRPTERHSVGWGGLRGEPGRKLLIYRELRGKHHSQEDMGKTTHVNAF